VVDDDAVSNRALVMALNRANLRATSAADPFVALKMVEKTPYDLVMLDIDMPGMDGITLCQKIRGLPDHARTPVIFVTGMQDFKLRAKSLLSGGSDLISKPILPLELTVKVITHLTRNAPVAAPV
jgi:DNA-binding response OmpR family regulator